MPMMPNVVSPYYKDVALNIFLRVWVSVKCIHSCFHFHKYIQRQFYDTIKQQVSGHLHKLVPFESHITEHKQASITTEPHNIALIDACY